MGVRYIGVKLSTGAIRHSKTRLAQTAGRGALEPRNSCAIYIIRRRYLSKYFLPGRIYMQSVYGRVQCHWLCLETAMMASFGGAGGPRER